MSAGTNRPSAADRDLRLLRLDHFNVPVRDLNVARKFYTEVLGGVVVHEGVWYWVPDPSGQGRAGGHIDVKLFTGSGLLQPFYQPWGQPAPDQLHPSTAFAASSPSVLQEIAGRLGRAGVPHVLEEDSSPSPGQAGGRDAVALRFRDPDGNQLAVTCPGQPPRGAVGAGSADPASLYYPWAEWRALVPYGGPPEDLAQHRSASAGSDQARRADHGTVERAFDLDGIDRFTMPVRNVERAELFYLHVVSGEVIERDVGGSTRSAVRLCPGAEVHLAQRWHGWSPADTPNPHWGFAIPGADVEQWLRHLDGWGVPWAMVVRTRELVENGVPTRVELHFTDPDGNQLELVAWDYPLNDRVERFNYNPWKLLYRWDSWPP